MVLPQMHLQLFLCAESFLALGSPAILKWAEEFGGALMRVNRCFMASEEARVVKPATTDPTTMLSIFWVHVALPLVPSQFLGPAKNFTTS